MIGLYFGVFLGAICSTLCTAHLLPPEMGPKVAHPAHKLNPHQKGGGGVGGMGNYCPLFNEKFFFSILYTVGHFPPILSSHLHTFLPVTCSVPFTPLVPPF